MTISNLTKRITILECFKQNLEEELEEWVPSGRHISEIERKRDQSTFSKKGHEEQFKHVVEVLEDLDDALEALEKKECDAAMNILKQGKELLKQRIQILKLVDMEVWVVVRQYQ